MCGIEFVLMKKGLYEKIQDEMIWVVSENFELKLNNRCFY